MRFTVYEPKERIIDAPHYRDKIVQLAINNVLKGYYNRLFIHDSYACIDGKGTHLAVDRLSYFLRKSYWQFGDRATIVKVDIRKFFYSIDRKVLKSILRKRIRCDKTLRLICKIIDSADDISPKGLPLGNTLSQICANIYMNELDQYCKRKLGVKYYLRYADDIVIIAESKETAKQLLDEVVLFLRCNLKLEVNENKTKIFPIHQGVNTIGYKIHKTHRLLRSECKKKIRRKARKLKGLLSAGTVRPEKVEQILNSWLGHARHGCSHNFTKHLLSKNDYIYMDGSGVLKVDMRRIRKDDDDAIF